MNNKTTYNFDQIFDRKQNKERKWDQYYIQKTYHLSGDDVLNSSIADLDFSTPTPIVNAIIKRATKRVYSYTYVNEEFYDAVKYWYETQHSIKLVNWNIKLVHGTVNALHQLIQCLTAIDDYILIQTPVYGPFGKAIRNNHRQILQNPLIWKDNRYYIDFDQFKKNIKQFQPKLFILCSPHNPSGRVWTKIELKQIVEICEQNNVIIIADEVHSDLVMPNIKFCSMLNFTPIANNIIICNSPNKAFNIGGLKSSYLITLNQELLNRINHQYEVNSITSPNVFSIPATVAAYTNQMVVEWRNQMVDYVYQNYLYCKQQLKNISGLEMMEVDASYLVWFNYEKTNITQKELDYKFLKYKLIVSKEDDFVSGELLNFRINIGTSRLVVEKIVQILIKIFNK